MASRTRSKPLGALLTARAPSRRTLALRRPIQAVRPTSPSRTATLSNRRALRLLRRPPQLHRTPRPAPEPLTARTTTVRLRLVMLTLVSMPMDRPPRMARHSRRARTTLETTKTTRPLALVPTMPRETMDRRPAKATQQTVKQRLSATQPPDRQPGKKTQQRARQQDKIMPPLEAPQQEQQPVARPPAQLCSQTAVSRRTPSLRTSTCSRAPSSPPW